LSLSIGGEVYELIPKKPWESTKEIGVLQTPTIKIGSHFQEDNKVVDVDEDLLFHIMDKLLIG
jgi:hypothetical protein